MDYAHPLALAVRRIGQKAGVLRPLVKLYRKIARTGYEDAFGVALLNDVRTADIVWDVGANTGLYSRKLAEAVGVTGKVVAFEPTPSTLQALRGTIAPYPQVTVVPVALADYSGVAHFGTSDHHESNTLNASAKSSECIEVKVERGDVYAVDQCPNVIKIDVEGFELDVVRGLTRTLAQPQLRSVFVEVHFLEMAKRGLDDGAGQLKAALEGVGLRVTWLDPSHIVARRA
ncbi:FkbM family methyltransferase [Xanthobacter flavus]|uniref:FkbM family methyltransferase n=1 Tax=Xanthobacter flavus TaxID=281 RepID=UPI00372CC554